MNDLVMRMEAANSEYIRERHALSVQAVKSVRSLPPDVAAMLSGPPGGINVAAASLPWHAALQHPAIQHVAAPPPLALHHPGTAQATLTQASLVEHNLSALSTPTPTPGPLPVHLPPPTAVYHGGAVAYPHGAAVLHPSAVATAHIPPILSSAPAQAAPPSGVIASSVSFAAPPSSESPSLATSGAPQPLHLIPAAALDAHLYHQPAAAVAQADPQAARVLLYPQGQPPGVILQSPQATMIAQAQQQQQPQPPRP